MQKNKEIIETILKKELRNETNTGKVFIIKGKEHFTPNVDMYVNQLRGEVVKERAALDQPTITHWTPNTYVRAFEMNGFVSGHRESNLRTINAFVIDLDSKVFNAEQINSIILDALFTIPTFILETPNGYQLYFVLEQAFYINQELKALTVAKEIMKNLKNCLKHVLPIDEHCNDFGFFRMPTNENVVRYTDVMHTPSEWMHWSMQQTDDRQSKKKYLTTVATQTNHTKQAWFNALLTQPHIKGSKGLVGRNNALFTLALACYADGVPYEVADELLRDFNAQLHEPIDKTEFQRTLASAYSDRYNGPTKEAVESLVKAYCPHVQIKMGSSNFFYKHAKKREDRVRSHLKEWETDLIAFINDRTQQEPFVQLTQKEIMEALHIPSSTLNKLLHKSKTIFTRSIGKGRGAITFYSTIDRYMEFYQKQKKPIVMKSTTIGLVSYAQKQALYKAFYKDMRHVIDKENFSAVP